MDSASGSCTVEVLPCYQKSKHIAPHDTRANSQFKFKSLQPSKTIDIVLEMAGGEKVFWANPNIKIGTGGKSHLGRILHFQENDSVILLPYKAHIEDPSLSNWLC